MSIANKLTYLSDTKEEIAEAINNIGGSITSETTFREYAQELDNIYDNLPKTTGEGTNLSLNTLKGKMNIIPKGNIEQETTTGKNKYFLPEATTTNGITYTINENGTINLSGTATANTSFVIFKSLEDTGITNTTYTLWANQTIPSGVEIKVEAYNGTTWQRHLIGGVLSNSTNTRTGTANITDTSRIRTGISISSGVTINISNLEIQFEQGSATTSFEKYTGGIASPNPSFPQDIEVVTGTQEVKVENKNYYTNNDSGTAEYETAFENNILTITAKRNTTGNLVFYKSVVNGNLVNGETYTISSTNVSGVVGSLKLQLRNKDGSNAGKPQGDSIVFDSNYALYVVSNVFGSSPSVQVTEGQQAIIKDIQIEKGSTATTYTPHQEQTQIIELSSKNLCYTNSSEWKIGQYDGTTGNKDNTQTARARIKELVKVTPNTTLYLTTGNNDLLFVIRGYDKNKTFLNSYGAINNASTIVTSVGGVGVEYLGVTIYNPNIQTGNEGQVIIDSIASGTTKPFICLNSETDKTFEEYYNYELCKIETYKDKLYHAINGNPIYDSLTSEQKALLNYGSWYKNKHIGKEVLNGSEPNWQHNVPTGSDLRRYYKTFSDMNAYTDELRHIDRFMCSSFKPDTSGNWGTAFQYKDQLFFFMYKSEFTDLATWTTWLSTHNVTLYYQLAKPNDIEITDTTLIQQLNNLEKLMSYNGTTNISSSGSLPMILNVSALKGE